MKCADCGYLAVRRPQTQELVCPTAEHRKTGGPAWRRSPHIETSARRRRARSVLFDDFGRDTGAKPKASCGQGNGHDERPCTGIDPWIPALTTPKEHLDMSIITENRRYNEEQLRLAREREDHRDDELRNREDARDTAQKTRENRRDFRQNISLVIATVAVAVSLVVWFLGHLFPPAAPPAPTIVIQQQPPPQPQTNAQTPKDSQ